MKGLEEYKDLEKYNEELHREAAAISKKIMWDGRFIQSKGRMMDVT